jgi:hypothetical protein
MKTNLLLLLFIYSVPCFAQTRDDIQKLGLTQSQERVSFEKRELILTNAVTGKTKHVKEQAFARITVQGDTTRMDVILEAFLQDSVIVSILKPKVADKKLRLEFHSFRVIPLQSISTIEYSIKHAKRAAAGVFILTLAGIEATVFPLVVPPLTDNTEEAYSQPHFPFLIVGGVAMFVGGRLLHKSLIPKEYRLSSEWQYSVISKK